MNPEHSRLKYYDDINNLKHTKAIYPLTKVYAKYNVEDDINTTLVDEIINVLSTLVWTLSDNIPYEQFIKSTEICFIDYKNVFVIIDVSDDNFGLFVGRNKNNIFAVKRFISNIAGKYSKSIDETFTITLEIKKFM